MNNGHTWMDDAFLSCHWKHRWPCYLSFALEYIVKRRTANAIEKSQRGKKAEVRKWMLYYDRQEIFEHTNKTKYSMEHDWMQSDNRTKVRGLQRIEELLLDAVKGRK